MSKLHAYVSFPFALKRKKKTVCSTIRSVFNDIPRLIEVLKGPEFVVVLVEDHEAHVGEEGVDSTLVRN